MHESSSKKSLDKCSFCGKKDDNEPFLENDDKTACICQNCAGMFANYEKQDSVDDSTNVDGIESSLEVFVCVKNGFREAQDSTSLVCAIFSISIDNEDLNESYSLVFGHAGRGVQADHFFKYFNYGANIAAADSSGGGWHTAWTYSSDDESFSEEIDAPNWTEVDEITLEKLREVSRRYLQVSSDDDEGSLVLIEDSIDSLSEFSENAELDWTAFASDGFDDEKLSNFSNIWSLKSSWS
jgi:hypothetical protein